ncbi:dynamin family protein [uncultured Campylobacter sp.]|mgnify:FL=1|uniref:dynamin family protein n=1 Tax=uncultured Campylobacter sp. TaxID=218934 RepID=UPI003211BD69
MFEEFINAYKTRYFKIFSDDFHGRFRRLQNELTEPKFHPSMELKQELNKLDLFLSGPLTVATLGQFSSGKSTFLNALLGSEILPSGLTPVTSKPTFIRYGAAPGLSVLYENGRELYLGVEEIGRFVDQRVFGDDVSRLCVYAPSEILKLVNFVDTPGLNSLSKADTAVTHEVLKDVAGVIWLSLADNAARASEAAQIEEFLADGGKTAICLLNQKDKLSKDELERLKNHAQATYGRFFERIIAVSAKQAVTAQANGDEALLAESNFSKVISAIHEFFGGEEIKEKFVREKCARLVAVNAEQHEKIAKIYEKAGEIIAKFDAELESNLKAVQENFKPKIELAFNELKHVAKLVADEILASLKGVKKYKYAPRKTLLKGEYFEASTYEAVDFDSEEVFSKLIYNDVKFAKFFRTYKRGLSALQEEIGAALDEIYARLEREFMIYKSEFENAQKEDETHSDTLFADVRTYAGQVYRTFLRDYETAKFKGLQKTALFFEKLNLKVAANYENAVKIAVYFLKEKIAGSMRAHEQNGFALFIPSFDEVQDRVLTSLNLYEFENEMLGNASFLNKILSALKSEFAQIKDEKITKIAALSAGHEKLRDEILKAGIRIDKR